VRCRRATRGFTLLELLVVMFLVTLTAGVVASRLSGATGGSELKVEARKLITLLRHTRARAISQSLSLGVGTAGDGSQYQIHPGDDQITLPEGLLITITPETDGVAAGQPFIYFYPDGSSNGGVLELQSAAGSYTLRVNWLTGEVALVDRE